MTDCAKLFLTEFKSVSVFLPECGCWKR